MSNSCFFTIRGRWTVVSTEMLNSLPVMLDWCSQTATSTIHLITMLWGWHGNYRWAAVTWTRRPHRGFFSYICYFITHFPPFLPFNFFFFFFFSPHVSGCLWIPFCQDARWTTHGAHSHVHEWASNILFIIFLLLILLIFLHLWEWA